MNKNNDVDHIIPKEQLRNKSSWFDAMLGRVRTDEWNNFYENVPTKLGSKFDNNEKLHGLLKSLYKIYCDIVGPFHILPDFLFLAPELVALHPCRSYIYVQMNICYHQKLTRFSILTQNIQIQLIGIKFYFHPYLQEKLGV